MTETTKTPAPDAAPATPAPRGLIPLPAAAARALLLTGGIATAASAFLAWTWTDEFPGDLTFNGYPGGLQWLTFTARHPHRPLRPRLLRTARTRLAAARP